MTDITKAIAAAREADSARSKKLVEFLTDENGNQELAEELRTLDRACVHTQRNLLAAIDAQKPVGDDEESALAGWLKERGLIESVDLPLSTAELIETLTNHEAEIIKAAPPAAVVVDVNAMVDVNAVPAGHVPLSALIEAREGIEEWGAYASPYHQQKHDLAGALARIDAVIAAAQKESNCE